MATGQITVAQELDYDAVGDRTAGATAGEYMVIVRATDPSGLADNITVTITAENVNEDPAVTGRAELTSMRGPLISPIPTLSWSTPAFPMLPV